MKIFFKELAFSAQILRNAKLFQVLSIYTVFTYALKRLKKAIHVATYILKFKKRY